MAEIKHLTHVNFDQNEIRYPVLHLSSGAPGGSPIHGQIFFDTITESPKFYHSSSGYVSMSSYDAVYRFANLIGGINTQGIFLVSGSAIIGPSGGGIINANQFNGNSIISILNGGTSVTGFNQGAILFGGIGSIGTSVNNLYWHQTSGLLGIGSGSSGNFDNNGLKGTVHIATSSGYAPIKIDKHILLPYNSGNQGIIEYDGTKFYLSAENAVRKEIATTGFNINDSSSGTLTLERGGTNNTSFPSMAVICTSGNPTDATQFYGLTGQGLVLVNGLFLPTVVSCLGNSGWFLQSNGAAWIATSGNTGIGNKKLFGTIFDGAGSLPATGIPVYSAPATSNCTLTQWTILSDVSGSATIDVFKSTYALFPKTTSIATSGIAKLDINRKAQNTNVAGSGWITNIAAGDILEFRLLSVSGCTRVYISLQGTS